MIKNSQNCNFASNFASCQNSNLTITYRSIYYWPVYILQDMDILDHRESNMLWMAGKCLVDNPQLDRCNEMTPMYSNNEMDMVIIPHIHRYLNSCKLAAVKNHSRSLRKSTFSTNRNVRWNWIFGKLSIWTRILKVHKSKQLCKFHAISYRCIFRLIFGIHHDKCIHMIHHGLNIFDRRDSHEHLFRIRRYLHNLDH